MERSNGKYVPYVNFCWVFSGESCVLIGYPNGQDGPILTALQSLITPRKKAFSLGHMVNDAFMRIGWWDVDLGDKTSTFNIRR